MPLCTEGFIAHLIICRAWIICFISCSKSKDAKAEVVWERDLFFKCSLTEIINSL